MIALRASWSIYAFTFILVAAMGLLAMCSLSSRPPTLVRAEAVERDVASVDGAAVPDFREHDKEENMLVEKVNCLEKADPIRVKAKQVRFLSRYCQPLKEKPLRMALINRTNGYEATVYELSDKSLTTDYVNLKVGDNTLEFIVEATAGNPQSNSFTVHRE